MAESQNNFTEWNKPEKRRIPCVSPLLIRIQDMKTDASWAQPGLKRTGRCRMQGLQRASGNSLGRYENRKKKLFIRIAEVCSRLLREEAAALVIPPGVGGGRAWKEERLLPSSGKTQLPGERKGESGQEIGGKGLVQWLWVAEGVIYLFTSGVFN